MDPARFRSPTGPSLMSCAGDAGSAASVKGWIQSGHEENHRKPIGKWWFNGIQWDIPSGNLTGFIGGFMFSCFVFFPTVPGEGH